MLYQIHRKWKDKETGKEVHCQLKDVRVGGEQNDRKRGGSLPIHSLYEREGYKKRRRKMEAGRITKELELDLQLNSEIYACSGRGSMKVANIPVLRYPQYRETFYTSSTQVI